MSSIVAHGIDLVDVSRLSTSINDHGEHFLDRCFTEGEKNYARAAKSPRDVQRFAARFAAKEAVMKALGTGWSQGVAWTDIEVRHNPDGSPQIDVKGRAQQIAHGLGIQRFLVSLSHTDGHAMASVIAIGP